MSLVALILVRNDGKKIINTLTSISSWVKHLVIYDNETTDNTVSIIMDYCEKLQIKLYLKRGGILENNKWDFKAYRTIILNYAESIFPKNTFFLFLNIGDELRNGEALNKFVQQYKGACIAFTFVLRPFSD